MVFFQAEVASLAGARVVCPDPGRCGLGRGRTGSGSGPAAVKVSPGRAWRAAASDASAALRRSAMVRTRTGRTGSRSRVRASMRALRCRWNLRWLISSPLTGQGTAHGRQAGGILDRPLRQVEVEGPDRRQALAVVDPRDVAHGLLAGARGDGLAAGCAAAVSRRRPPRRAGAGWRCPGGGAPGPARSACPGSGTGSSGLRSPARPGAPAGSPPAGHGPGGTASA